MGTPEERGRGSNGGKGSKEPLGERHSFAKK